MRGSRISLLGDDRRGTVTENLDDDNHGVDNDADHDDVEDDEKKDLEVGQISLLGLGNPLVSLTCEVSAEFWNAHNLEANTSKSKQPFGTEELLRKHHPRYGYGGPMMQTLSRLRHLVPGNEEIAVVGSVGDDAHGGLLREMCEMDGITHLFRISPDMPTGTVLNLGCQQTFCRFVNRGAAKDYEVDHLRFKIWEMVERASFIYCTAAFILNSPSSVIHLAEHCVRREKTFFFSLSASFLLSYFTRQVAEILPFTDYIFCNRHEALIAKTLTVKYNGEKGDADLLEEDLTLDEMARRLVLFPTAHPDVKRCVIITDGPHPVTVARLWCGHGVKIEKYPVKPMTISEMPKRCAIAGDSFVAGFLASFLAKKTFEECITNAIEVAQKDILKERSREAFKVKKMRTSRSIDLADIMGSS